MNKDQPQCKVCDNGSLYKKKIYRLPSPIFVFGYIFLIPSLLLIPIVILLFLTGIIGGPARIKKINQETRLKLEAAKIPQAVIDKSSRSLLSLNAIDLQGLSKEQIRLIKKLQFDNAKGNVSTVAAGGFAVLLSIILGLFAVIGTIVGFLLTMKKKVLQCSGCEAIVPIS